MDWALERRLNWKRNLGISFLFFGILDFWRSDRTWVESAALLLLGSFLILDFSRPDGESVSAYLKRPRVFTAQVIRLGAIGCFVYLLVHMK
jgi:hypothetical protein